MNRLFLKLINRYIDIIHNKKLFANNIFFSLALENFIAFISRKDVRFSFNKKKKLIKAQEKNLIKFYRDPSRCFWLYRNGIRARGKFLHKSYCIDKLNFSSLNPLYQLYICNVFRFVSQHLHIFYYT